MKIFCWAFKCLYLLHQIEMLFFAHDWLSVTPSTISMFNGQHFRLQLPSPSQPNAYSQWHSSTAPTASAYTPCPSSKWDLEHELACQFVALGVIKLALEMRDERSEMRLWGVGRWLSSMIQHLVSCIICWLVDMRRLMWCEHVCWQWHVCTGCCAQGAALVSPWLTGAPVCAWEFWACMGGLAWDFWTCDTLAGGYHFVCNEHAESWTNLASMYLSIWVLWVKIKRCFHMGRYIHPPCLVLFKH